MNRKICRVMDSYVASNIEWRSNPSKGNIKRWFFYLFFFLYILLYVNVLILSRTFFELFVLSESQVVMSCAAL